MMFHEPWVLGMLVIFKFQNSARNHKYKEQGAFSALEPQLRDSRNRY